MTRLLVATSNAGKLKEIEDRLQFLPYSIVDLTKYPSINRVDETGDTFLKNACLKAAGYARQAKALTLSDDSGLMVDALKGMPGVHSARYGGEGMSYAGKMEKLLTELGNVSEESRTAQFVSVVAIADQNGRVISHSTGQCRGLITCFPRGTNGFGFDPIFQPDGFDRTFAELSPELKNRISHRAQALAKACEFLRTLTVSYRDS